MSTNPFAALLSNATDDESSQEEPAKPSSIHNTLEIASPENLRITSIVHDVFRITLNDTSVKPDYMQLIYLEELSESLKPQKYIDLETLEQALFERLLLPNPIPFVIPKNAKSYDQRVIENKVVLYLHSCFHHLKQYMTSDDPFIKSVSKEMKGLILRNVSTAMEQPDLFPDQVMWQQWLEIFKESTLQNSLDSFIVEVAAYIAEGENSKEILENTFTPILVHVYKTVSCQSLMSVEGWLYKIISMFSSNISLATVLLNYTSPKGENGCDYSNSILGAFLSLSVLPKTFAGSYDYFDNPLEQVQNSHGPLCSALEFLADTMHSVFMNLLRLGQDIRPKTLDWIANCLHSNTQRGQLWNTQVLEISPSFAKCASDAFMLNLGAVLLRMCRPFCKDYKNVNILKIDPTYCAALESINAHAKCLANDTCLLPVEENTIRPCAVSFNFTTECYFLTQKCLDLGYRVCVEQLTRQNQDMARLQRAYNDARSQGSPAADQLLQGMTHDMTKYLSLKCTLFEPSTLQHLTDFHVATSVWLTQVAISNSSNTPTPLTSYAPTNFLPIEFPLSDNVPNTLRCIPELVVENTIGFFPFVRRFGNGGPGFESLVIAHEPILTLLLIFMSTNDRMKNPHLKAKLAECLESLLPRLKEDHPMTNSLNFLSRERLFTNHPHRLQIVASLLNVFVDIEMTGQSVAFEQKFNYRKPMYIVMGYLWSIHDHQNCFKSLAIYAEKNMEAVTPPIFLRFINLLLNDAVFLLDESLSNMTQIRTMQAARTNGEWSNLPIREREQNEGSIRHIGMMARFDNILGRETIRTIQMLTSEIKEVFCHSAMVNRVASMLNYFLLNLVGPNNKNFKVKDSQEYDFDPANTVLNICRIYVHLSGSDSFSLAVSQDGRSYSPQLFELAEDVLVRIGGGPLIGDLRMVATKVQDLAVKQQLEDEALQEAPDEFLDPIMSTLMLDPVVLPSSRTTVDRTTIARHLLSDQTDPFNRSPLNMNEVKSNTELKAKIDAWIKERKTKIDIPEEKCSKNT